MRPFEIVAHRGVHHSLPENSLAAFEQAVNLGADAIEFDVRLNADRIPFVYHYYYLDDFSTLSGPIFQRTAAELDSARLVTANGHTLTDEHIPRLVDVLDHFAGRISLEIEIKGPEPESASVIAEVLEDYRWYWDSFETTSYEPLLLQELRRRCPGLAADLLFPRPEPWMKADVTAYTALQRARQVGARAVHLHPSQLTESVVKTIQSSSIVIHSWDVNTPEALQKTWELGISRIDTDQPEQALDFRRKVRYEPKSIS